jgi:hypothetical protein
LAYPMIPSIALRVTWRVREVDDRRPLALKSHPSRAGARGNSSRAPRRCDPAWAHPRRPDADPLIDPWIVLKRSRDRNRNCVRFRLAGGGMDDVKSRGVRANVVGRCSIEDQIGWAFCYGAVHGVLGSKLGFTDDNRAVFWWISHSNGRQGSGRAVFENCVEPEPHFLPRGDRHLVGRQLLAPRWDQLRQKDRSE